MVFFFIGFLVNLRNINKIWLKFRFLLNHHQRPDEYRKKKVRIKKYTLIKNYFVVNTSIITLNIAPKFQVIFKHPRKTPGIFSQEDKI